MKSMTFTSRSFAEVTLAICIGFVAAALPRPSFAQPSEPPPSGTNSIYGTIRFTNADADILARLGPPGNEGMSSFSLQAYTDVPEPLQSSKSIFGADPLSNPYSLTVAANDLPITYTIFAALALDTDTQEYWTPRIAAAALTSNSPPALVDFDECVALVELRYVDSAGAPVMIGGGRVEVRETASGIMRARIYSQAAGVSSEFLAVPSGIEIAFNIDVDTGSDIYLNRVTHRETRTATYACDEKPVLTVIIPDAGTLGRITGNANLVGEIELATEGYLELLGRPVIKATGPAGNQRYAALPAEAPGPDATRPFALEGLVPSTVAQPWNLWSETHFRSGHRFEHFRSPGLGEGAFNVGVVLGAGGAGTVGDALVMNPARLVGDISLIGPPEFAGATSALRHMVRASDFDADMDGIPDAIGATTMNGSYVVMAGVDELVPGSTYTTAGGQATVTFAGGYNPTTSAFEGDYEAIVGMLDNQPGVWEQDGVAVRLYDEGTSGGPHVDQLIYVSENVPWQGILGPGERATNHLRYGMAEVCLRIKSPANFFSPRVGFSTGGLTGMDSEGNFRSYAVQILNAYSPPHSAALATNEAVITFLVPEGSYTLKPAISVPDEGGGHSDVQLPSVEVTVAARERYCIEECLSIVLTTPTCTTNNGFLTFADAYSCDSTLTNLSLTTTSLDYPGVRLGYSDIRILEPAGVPRATLRTGHGLFPEYDGFTPDHYRNLVITAVAKDTKGRVATRQIIAHYDFTPPVLNCTNLTVNSSNGVDAVVTFTPAISADDILDCTPPSGSTFPIGVTTVTCVARDLCRNTNTCTFDVTVLDANGGCDLRIALTQVSPPEVTLTWNCTAVLQASVNADGPWINVDGATSPYVTPADGLHQFFRLCLSGDCDVALPPAPTVYEPFDYFPAAPLANQNGGFGFAGAWDPTSTVVVEELSLAFSPLATQGGACSGVGFNGGSRPLITPLGADGTTVYLSFLLQPGSASPAGTVDGYYGISLFGSVGGLFVGKPGGQGGMVGVSQEYVVENFGGTSQAFDGTTVTPHETVLLVLKCEFLPGNDTFTLYVNPTPGSAEPLTGAAKTDADIGTCSSLTISSGYDATHTFVIDEIRLGATFESVMPRP